MNGSSGITHVPAPELSRWLHDPGLCSFRRAARRAGWAPWALGGRGFPEPSVTESSDGRLWFATTRGIAWLDPVALHRNRDRLPPPVIISSVISNGKAYPGFKRPHASHARRQAGNQLHGPQSRHSRTVMFRYSWKVSVPIGRMPAPGGKRSTLICPRETIAST